MDIENIAKRMMKKSRKFYQDAGNLNNIQQCKKHRKYLGALMQEARILPDKNKRVIEIIKILNDAVIFFDIHIFELENRIN